MAQKAAALADETPPQEELDVLAPELLTLEAPATGADKPIIRARIVYLGTLPNKSLSLRGRVLVERTEQRDSTVFEAKSASPDGRTVYDFSTHDTVGRLIRARQMPPKAPARIAGRPWAWCEHPDHLLRFDDHRNAEGAREFLVVFLRLEDKRVMDEYALQARRHRARRQEALERTIDGRPGI